MVRVGYLDGHGVLRGVLALCTSRGWKVADMQVESEDRDAGDQRTAVVALRLQGKQPVQPLVDEITEISGVVHAAVAEPTEGGI